MSATNSEEPSASDAVSSVDPSVWNEDYFVDLIKKGKNLSYAWSYFGLLRNKKTKATHFDKYYFCQICVEEKHLLTVK